MELSENKITEYVQRIVASRTRLLCNNGFYGLLLMNMKFALDENIETACTDGEKTYFSPAFLDEISDKELDFVLMHEVLHVVLQHCTRTGDRNNEIFNIACDIVVNSNILYSNDMDERCISLKDCGVLMHQTPNGEEGYLYTAEQVYDMLIDEFKDFKSKVKKDFSESSNQKSSKSSSSNHGKKGDGKSSTKKGYGSNSNGKSGGNDSESRFEETFDYKVCDNHDYWGRYDEASQIFEDWNQRFKNACESMHNRGDSAGRLPVFAERLLQELKKPQIDWRLLLNDFIQEDICDYSFSPPDKRFQDSNFILPDFNEPSEIVKNILFCVDTSGSISLSDLTMAFSEIKGAIEQFGGKLQGKLAFFDASVKEPIRDFDDVASLLQIRPVGGGGTDFNSVFRFIKNKMINDLPSAIIILTDGVADFPAQENALGIPVLWVINNERITPPWGKIARIKVKNR